MPFVLRVDGSYVVKIQLPNEEDLATHLLQNGLIEVYGMYTLCVYIWVSYYCTT